MKKYGSLIALAVVLLLAIVYVATREKPVEKVKAPYSIAKVEKLSRIELTKPGDQLVVLEKRGDDWFLTKPVEAPVAERVDEQLDESFAKKINTDDLPVAADKAADYELDDAKAVKVALFPEGATAPLAEFFIGKTISVPETRAKRTFIKTSDGKFYRAQTDLGEVLNKPVEDLRSKQVQKIDREAISKVSVKYQDGTTIELQNDKDTGWQLAEPKLGIALESSQVSTLVTNLSNLVATGFVDDKKPADVDLEPPYAEIAAKAGEDIHRLFISQAQDREPKDVYFVKKPKSPHIFEISETTGKALTPTVGSLRSRLVHDVKKEDITRMEFAGDDRVVVKKADDGTWQFERPNKGNKVKQTALDSRLSSFAQLRALRFEEPTLAEAGLDRPDVKLSFTAGGKDYTFLIGKEADEKGNLYGKWADSDLIMVVGKWVKDRAMPKASELAEEES